MPVITVPTLGQYGVVQDQAPHELPVNAWSDARNFRFRDGWAERVGGQAQFGTTPSITPYFLAPYTTSTARFWVHAGTAKVFADDGTTQTEITPASPFTGAQDDRWTGGSLGGILILNNGVEKPQYWAGNVVNDLADLTAWDANWRCKFMRPFKNFLIAGDVTKSGTRYPHMVKWSHSADPGSLPTSWDAADASKDAGEQDLAETPDLLVDMLPLNSDVAVVYKERSMYGMQYIGQPYIWRFFRMPGDHGMLARGCAVNTPKGHVVLTAGDVVIHNGQGPESLLTQRLRSALFNDIDSTYYGRSFVTANPRYNEAWICYPQVGQSLPSRALVWNWIDNTFGFRDITNVSYGAVGQINYSAGSTWAADTETWADDATKWNQDPYSPAEGRLILAQSTPKIVIADTSNTFAGTTITAYIERTGLAFDQPDVVKTIKSLVPRVDAAVGTQITVEFGGSMDAERPPTWQSSYTYTVGTSRRAHGFATGRYLAVRFSSSSAQGWRIKSYDAEIDFRGRF